MPKQNRIAVAVSDITDKKLDIMCKHYNVTRSKMMRILIKSAYSKHVERERVKQSAKSKANRKTH